MPLSGMCLLVHQYLVQLNRRLCVGIHKYPLEKGEWTAFALDDMYLTTVYLARFGADNHGHNHAYLHQHPKQEYRYPTYIYPLRHVHPSQLGLLCSDSELRKHYLPIR